MPEAPLKQNRLSIRWADAAGVACASVLVAGPALFTHNGFAPDFTNHLWLVWVQEQAISQHHAPTYFVSASPVGVFYPFFAFYGGTLYAVTGALAALIGGHVIAAFVAATVLAAAAAYGGVLWLSRQLGARSWMAHAPAVAFVTSAYYVSNLYGRGAWTEFMATSAIPLLVASGWRLSRSERVELVPTIAFLGAAIIFAGSHNITLELGALVIVLGLLGLWLALGRSVLPRSRQRAAQLAGLLLLAFAVNAWFLVPDAVHASQTAIGASGLIPWRAYSFFDTPGMLFNPLRAVPSQSSSPSLYVQAPDWFLLWVLVAGAGVWSLTTVRLRRAAGALLILLAALLAAVLIGPVWDALPRPLREIQFPYRLDSYIALCVAGLVLIGVLAVQKLRAGRRQTALGACLAASTAISIGLCVWQLWFLDKDASGVYPNRDAALVSTHLAPATWYDTGSYADASQPVIAHRVGAVAIAPSLVAPNRASVVVDPPAGAAPFATNIAGGPYVVAVSGGVVRVGRTKAGLTVARRRRPGSGPIPVKLSVSGGALTVGRWITFVALAIIGILAVWTLGRRITKR